MKNPEELNAFKNEFETLSKKLTELTEKDLMQVTGGTDEDDFHEECFNHWMEWLDLMESSARSFLPNADADQRYHFMSRLDELLQLPPSYWEDQFHLTKAEYTTILGRIAQLRSL